MQFWLYLLNQFHFRNTCHLISFVAAKLLSIKQILEGQGSFSIKAENTDGQKSQLMLNNKIMTSTTTRKWLIFNDKYTPLFPTFLLQTTPNTHTNTSPTQHRANHKPAASLKRRWFYLMSITKEKGSMTPKVNSNLKEITCWHFISLQLAHKLS